MGSFWNTYEKHLRNYFGRYGRLFATVFGGFMWKMKFLSKRHRPTKNTPKHCKFYIEFKNKHFSVLNQASNFRIDFFSEKTSQIDR